MELLWVDIKLKHFKLLVGVIYRPPNESHEWWDTLQSNINYVVENNINSKILILGDLNSDPNTVNGNILKEFCNFNNLIINIDKPTRITETSQTILDQKLTNFDNIIVNTEIYPPLKDCDHCSIGIF